MKMRRFSVVVLTFMACAMATTGCVRALRDGVSIGVTDGLGDGIAAVVADIIVSTRGG